MRQPLKSDNEEARILALKSERQRQISLKRARTSKSDTSSKESPRLKGNNPMKFDDESYVDMSQDFKKIKQQTCSYKTMYLTLALFIGSSALIEFTFDLYTPNSESSGQDFVNMSLAVAKITIFLLPYAIKPLFGLLADLYYPCRYRIKSYVILVTLVNFMMLVILLSIEADRTAKHWLYLIVIYMVCAGLIDSLAQGITSISRDLSERLRGIESIKYGSNRDSSTYVLGDIDPLKEAEKEDRSRRPSRFSTNFAIFSVAVEFARAVGFVIVGIYYEQLGQDSEQEMNKFYTSVFQVIGIISLGVMAVFLCTPELKQVSTKRERLKKENKRSCGEVIRLVVADGGWEVVLFVTFLAANPTNYNVHTLNSVWTYQLQDTRPNTVQWLLTAHVVGALVYGVLQLGLAKYVGKMRLHGYVFLVIVCQLASNLSMFIFCKKNNGNTITDSMYALYTYIAIQSTGMIMGTRLLQVCLLDNLFERIEQGKELFMTNLLTSVVFFGIIPGYILAFGERIVFNISLTDWSGLDKLAGANAAYTVFTALVYLVWRAVSRDTSKN